MSSDAEDLARTTRRLYELGWMRGTSGNVAVVASDGELLITASGVGKHSVTSAHAVRTDERGAARPGQDFTPSAEAQVHAAILRLAGARATTHVHALSAVLAAERWPEGVPLIDVEQLKGIGRGAHGDGVVVPVVANSQDMEDLAARVTEAMDLAVPCVIVAQHGLYAWGRDLAEATDRTESLDWLFEHALGLDRLRREGAV